MGNSSSVYSSDNEHYAFVGRSKDEDIFEQLLEQKDKRIIGVYGMKKVGKSRFIARKMQSLENKPDTICILCDFEAEDDEDFYYDCFEELFTRFGHDCKKLMKLKNLPKCDGHANCKLKQNSCEMLVKIFKCIVCDLVKCFNTSGKRIYLILDNVDVVMRTIAKEYFMEFIQTLSLKCECLKIVLSSTYKLKYKHKLFAELELKPIEDNYIEDLLHNITNGKFKEKQIYMKSIARLCEGLPIAAEMAGARLLDDKGFFIPEELVELLIVERLKALSPDTFPGSNRLDQLKKPIVDFETAENDSPISFCELFSRLIMSMKDTEITVDDAMTASNTTASKAMFKLASLKPFVDRSIATINGLDRTETLQIHRCLRECKLALEILRNTEKVGGPLEKVILQLIRENAQRAGLDVGDDVLSDPKALEKAVLSLGIQEIPGKDTDEQSFKQTDDIKVLSHKNDSNDGQALPEQPVQPLVNGYTGDNLLNIVNTFRNQVTDGRPVHGSNNDTVLNIFDTSKPTFDYLLINGPPTIDCTSELLNIANEPKPSLESLQQSSLEDNAQVPFDSVNQSCDVDKIQVQYSVNNCSTEKKVDFEIIANENDKVNLQSSKNGYEYNGKINDENGSNIMLPSQINIASQELIINSSKQSQCTKWKHLPVEHDDDTMNLEGSISETSLHVSSDKSHVNSLTHTTKCLARTENIQEHDTHMLDESNVNNEGRLSISAEDNDVQVFTKQPDVELHPSLWNESRDKNDTIDSQTHKKSCLLHYEGNLLSNDKNENSFLTDNLHSFLSELFRNW